MKLACLLSQETTLHLLAMLNLIKSVVEHGWYYLSYLSENVVFLFPFAGSLQLNQESEASMDTVSNITLTYIDFIFYFLLICDSFSVLFFVYD